MSSLKGRGGFNQQRPSQFLLGTIISSGLDPEQRGGAWPLAPPDPPNIPLSCVFSLFEPSFLFSVLS